MSQKTERHRQQSRSGTPTARLEQHNATVQASLCAGHTCGQKVKRTGRVPCTTKYNGYPVGSIALSVGCTDQEEPVRSETPIARLEQLNGTMQASLCAGATQIKEAICGHKLKRTGLVLCTSSEFVECFAGDRRLWRRDRCSSGGFACCVFARATKVENKIRKNNVVIVTRCDNASF